ncbi:MAG TPA: hypothetical protein VGG50_11685 [Streptosporangiaceae bacterium]
MLRVPRSRGALSGLLLVLLGAWGVLVPFIGPYFHYAYTPDSAWTYTTGRFWLEILPGCATVLGGLIVLASSSRPFAIFGAWLAAVSGAWFALGNVLAPIFSSNGLQMNIGAPVGGTVTRALEQIGFFTGLGLAIVLLAGMALGRFSVIGVRETRLAERAAKARAEREAAEREAAARTEPVTPVTTGPVSHQPDATTTAALPRRAVPERKTDQDADTGTTTAETRPDGERVDSAAQ